MLRPAARDAVRHLDRVRHQPAGRRRSAGACPGTARSPTTPCSSTSAASASANSRSTAWRGMMAHGQARIVTAERAPPGGSRLAGGTQCAAQLRRQRQRRSGRGGRTHDQRIPPRAPPQGRRTITVIDTMTDTVVGRIGNLSETGMLLIANAPLVEDALYQLRFLLPDPRAATCRSRSARTCCGWIAPARPARPGPASASSP